MKPNPNKGKGITIEKIKALKDKGLTNREVGKLVGCTHQNVAQRIQEWQEEFKTLDFYRENKLAILDSLQYKILCSIDWADLKRMALRDRITAYGILFDKSRITAGDDVVKIDVRLLHGDLEEITRKKEELKAKLTSLTLGAMPQPQA